jgi:hypothetical protein
MITFQVLQPCWGTVGIAAPLALKGFAKCTSKYPLLLIITKELVK